MEKTLFGSAKIRNIRLEYYLVAEPLDGKRMDYGVELRTSGGECSCVRGVTISRERIGLLLSDLMTYTVTPTTLRDVIDDWLP